MSHEAFVRFLLYLAKLHDSYYDLFIAFRDHFSRHDSELRKKAKPCYNLHCEFGNAMESAAESISTEIPKWRPNTTYRMIRDLDAQNASSQWLVDLSRLKESKRSEIVSQVRRGLSTRAKKDLSFMGQQLTDAIFPDLEVETDASELVQFPDFGVDYVEHEQRFQRGIKSVSVSGQQILDACICYLLDAGNKGIEKRIIVERVWGRHPRGGQPRGTINALDQLKRRVDPVMKELGLRLDTSKRNWWVIRIAES